MKKLMHWLGARPLSVVLRELSSQPVRRPGPLWFATPGRYPPKTSGLRIPFTPRIGPHETRSLNVVLMGTCQVAALVQTGQSLGHTVRHMLFELHSSVPSLDASELDAIVLSLTFRHLIVGDTTIAKLRTTAQVAEVLDHATPLMNQKLHEIRDYVPRLPLFVSSFLEPSFNYRGNLLSAYDPIAPRQIIRELNRRLSDAVSKLHNSYIVDFNDIINWLGRMHLQDDAVAGSLHAAFIDEGTALDRDRLAPIVGNGSVFDYPRYQRAFGEIFWQLMSDNLDILQQYNPVKLIVVDLDDTLWRGVAAEDDLEPRDRVEGWPLGFVEGLLFFKGRGGLLAICSKNDREQTLKRLSEIWRGAITADDFVSIKINYDSKAENIEKISRETNILTKNILFVDDNPRELDEVQSRFYDIRVLRGRHLDWRRIVMRSPETQVPAVSDESLRRTELVRASAERRVSRPGFSRTEWLASLKLRERIDVVTTSESSDGKRALELLNKTNQFNTTGMRWSPGGLTEFLGSNGVCLVARLTDKNLDNGIVGVALVKKGEIVQAVLSCRVFGLGVEVALGNLATAVALEQANKATGRIVDTGRNFSCHNFFEEIGFRRNGDHFEGGKPCDVPSWIELVHGDKVQDL